MEHTGGIPLSLVSPNIWKGGNKSNGQLTKLHTFHLSTGYAQLVITASLKAELDTAGVAGVPFGNGLFYDRNIKTTAPNKVYAGYPTAVGAKPKLAGVLAYDPAPTSMNPADAKGVQTYGKGEIIKRGFVRYKTGKNAALNAAVAYADIDDSAMLFFIENATGDPVFAAPTGYGSVTTPTFTAATVADVVTALSNKSLAMSGLVPILANCTYAGRIVMLYPEDQSVLVELDF